MKTAYFVYFDPFMHDRRSDGVELCVIPQFGDGRIYFYCSEYAVFWKNVDDAGDMSKSVTFKLSGPARPATLDEICLNSLSGYLDMVKEYDIEGTKLRGITRIQLSKTSPQT